MAHIFVTREIPDTGFVILREAGHKVTTSPKQETLSHDELIHALQGGEYDAIISTLTDHIDAAVMDAAPQLRIVSNYAVGLDNVDLKEVEKRGITVVNTPGVLDDAVAEHTIGLLFALAKRIPEMDTFTRSGEYKGWGPLLSLGTQIRGKTLGIVGAGRIGVRVATLAACLGLQVRYFDIQKNDTIERQANAVFEATLEDLLRSADFVSLHVPLNSSTHHLINAESLRHMKPTAFLINTSRGAVIDEAALVTALSQSLLQGAALDVFEHEPALAPGLAELSNVILTPHTASATRETREAMSTLVAQKIVAFFGEIPNPIE